jgi:hypothetical protein
VPQEAAEARSAAERQAALEWLGDMYLQFAVSPDGSCFLEALQVELTAPRTDPGYLDTVLAND